MDLDYHLLWEKKPHLTLLPPKPKALCSRSLRGRTSCYLRELGGSCHPHAGPCQPPDLRPGPLLCPAPPFVACAPVPSTHTARSAQMRQIPLNTGKLKAHTEEAM